MTLVERNLIGGECTYWACMPSKTLLRAPELLAGARRTPGAAEAITGELDVERIFWWRDQVVESHDDSGHVEWLEERNIESRAGHGARRPRPGVLEVDGRELDTSGSSWRPARRPPLPPLPGLEQIDFWTNHEATATSRGARDASSSSAPGRWAASSASSSRARARRSRSWTSTGGCCRARTPEASELLEAAVPRGGDRAAARARRPSAIEPPCRLRVEDGTTIEADRLLVASGPDPERGGARARAARRRAARPRRDQGRRAPPGRGERLGDRRRERRRAAHARRQVPGARGGRRTSPAARRAPTTARSRAVTFTDPQIASVGKRDGDGLVTVDSGGLPSRASTYQRPRPDGFLKLSPTPSGACSSARPRSGRRRGSGSSS